MSALGKEIAEAVLGGYAYPDEIAAADAAIAPLVEACDDALKALRLCKFGLRTNVEAVKMIDAHIDELEHILKRAETDA